MNICEIKYGMYILSDINECQKNNGGCSDQCVNTEGSYECVCPSGYKVQADQKTCEGMVADINKKYLTYCMLGNFVSFAVTFVTSEISML